MYVYGYTYRLVNDIRVLHDHVQKLAAYLEQLVDPFSNEVEEELLTLEKMKNVHGMFLGCQQQIAAIDASIEDWETRKMALKEDDETTSPG